MLWFEVIGRIIVCIHIRVWKKIGDFEFIGLLLYELHWEAGGWSLNWLDVPVEAWLTAGQWKWTWEVRF